MEVFDVECDFCVIIGDIKGDIRSGDVNWFWIKDEVLCFIWFVDVIGGVIGDGIKVNVRFGDWCFVVILICIDFDVF